MDKYKFKKDLDLLSIDVDGQDYHIFNSLKKYKPKIIIIESNMTMNSESIIIENEQKILKIILGLVLAQEQFMNWQEKRDINCAYSFLII